MKYAVGDKVRARKDIAYGLVESLDGLEESCDALEKYAGQILTIEGVFPDDEQYLVKEENDHYWTDDILEPLNPKESVDDILEQMYAELDEYKDKLHEALYSDIDNINQNKQPEKKYYYHLIGGNNCTYINLHKDNWCLSIAKDSYSYQATFTDEEIKKCPYVLAGFEKIEIK